MGCFFDGEESDGMTLLVEMNDLASVESEPTSVRIERKEQDRKGIQLNPPCCFLLLPCADPTKRNVPPRPQIFSFALL